MNYDVLGGVGMKMEKMSREILVTLSEADQKAFGVCYDTMSFSDLRTRRFCEHVAVLVCLREGISEAGNVTVRAVENTSGELLLYFSLPTERSERCLYSRVIEFFDLDGLLDCRHVLGSDPNLCAEVYGYDNKYYLWYEYCTCPDSFDRLTSRLLEYGSPTGVDRSFLSEHGRLFPSASAFLLN